MEKAYESFGEGLRRSFAKPNPFVLTNKICLNQGTYHIVLVLHMIEIK